MDNSQNIVDWTDSFVDPSVEQYIESRHLTQAARVYWDKYSHDFLLLLDKGDENLSEDEDCRLWDHYYNFRHLTTAKGSIAKDDYYEPDLAGRQRFFSFAE